MSDDSDPEPIQPGLGIGPPPWVLGHRGAPRDAPENTRASLRRALELGLDGFEYDLRACSGGEAVLFHDASLERTTGESGMLAEQTLPQLFRLDAGGWFSKRFDGEGIPLFREVLEEGPEHETGATPFHMIELKERNLVGGVARALSEMRPPPEVRIASFLRSVVVEAHDAGLPAMLLQTHANEDDRRFVRDHRIRAMGVGPSGWRNAAGAADWSFCERWCYSVDEPRDLMEACDGRLFGFNTNEPARALATRALMRLCEGHAVPTRYPVVLPALTVQPEALDAETRESGEWYGRWRPTARIENPFPFEVQASCELYLRSGAFRVTGLPKSLRLQPGEQAEIPFDLTGGSRVPGADPLFALQLRWWPGLGRSAGSLIFDAPLRRVRSVNVDDMARRLTMLEERKGDPAASITARRRGHTLLLSLEQDGGLQDPHLLAVMGDELIRGGAGMRIPLPADFDSMSEHGYSFTCGVEGKQNGQYRLRRWSGGLPEGLGHGLPGRLHPLARG
ncbi:MAG: hypothetical protein ACI835_000844 [Planctomycetota bacterium]|jgi:hypothetical protein